MPQNSGAPMPMVAQAAAGQLGLVMVTAMEESALCPGIPAKIKNTGGSYLSLG